LVSLAPDELLLPCCCCELEPPPELLELPAPGPPTPVFVLPGVKILLVLERVLVLLEPEPVSRLSVSSAPPRLASQPTRSTAAETAINAFFITSLAVQVRPFAERATD
jgi:hypothetical protein